MFDRVDDRTRIDTGAGGYSLACGKIAELAQARDELRDCRIRLPRMDGSFRSGDSRNATLGGELEILRQRSFCPPISIVRRLDLRERRGHVGRIEHPGPQDLRQIVLLRSHFKPELE